MSPQPPQDVWTRMAWLDVRCEVQISRVDGLGERLWCVRLVPRDHADRGVISVMAATLVSAVHATVREAELRGWFQAASDQPGTTDPYRFPGSVQAS